jgi:hypothetical protein
MCERVVTTNIQRIYNLKIQQMTLFSKGLGLWCLTPLSTIFKLYIVVVSFIGGGKTSVPGENHRPAVASH